MEKTKVRWKLMWLIVFPLTLLMSLDRTTLAVSAPIISKEYGYSLVQMSVILTAFFWSYAPCNIPAGIWAQKVGPHKGMVVASSWWALLTLLTPCGIAIFPLLIVMRLLLGAGQAVDWPASIGFINKWFTKTEKARASSILLGGLYCGTVVGKPLTAWIVDRFGWAWSFWSFGAVSLLITLLWWKYIRNNPQESSLPNEAEKRHIAEGADTAQVSKVPWREWKEFLGKVQFWAFGLQYFTLLLIQSFYTTWLPTYLLATRNLSMVKMGFLASLPWISMVVSVFLFGAVADWVYKKTQSPIKARLPFAICGFIIAASSLYLGAVAEDMTIMIVFLMVSMMGLGMTQVSIWSTCQDIGGPRATVLSGWVNFCGNMGNAIGPILTAFVVNATGGNWSNGLTVLAAAGVFGAVLWLFVRPNRPIITGTAKTQATMV